MSPKIDLSERTGGVREHCRERDEVSDIDKIEDIFSVDHRYRMRSGNGSSRVSFRTKLCGSMRTTVRNRRILNACNSSQYPEQFFSDKLVHGPWAVVRSKRRFIQQRAVG